MSALASPSAGPTWAIGTVGQGTISLGSRGILASTEHFRLLHPESELKAAVTGEVAEDLVVVHRPARALDFPSDPRLGSSA